MIDLMVYDFVVLKALTALYQRLIPEEMPPRIEEKPTASEFGSRSCGELSRLM